MAAKVNILTLLQEMDGFAHIAERCPAPRSPGFLLAQLRSRGNHDSLRRRKLNIVIEEPNQPPIPLLVKIHHVKQTPGPAARIPAP
jgi:hypothetical protein